MRQEFGTESTIGAARRTDYSSSVVISEDLTREREEAAISLKRFSGILERSQTATREECQKDLEAIRLLKRDIPTVLGRLETAAEITDSSLISLLRETLTELPILEREIRDRLNQHEIAAGKVVDIAALREELAARAARRELGIGNHARDTAPLEIEMKRSSPAGIPILIFGFSWLSFTTFHACLMIGGLSRAIGPAALFLLGFYAIFFTVGFGMLWSGLSQFRKEALVLSGRQFTLRYSLFGHTREKTHLFDVRSRAWVTTPVLQQKGVKVEELAVLTGEGKEVRMGNGLPAQRLYEEAARINDHVNAVFAGER